MKKLLSFFGFLLIIGLASQVSATPILNGSFESAGTGTGDAFSDWTETGANGGTVIQSQSIWSHNNGQEFFATDPTQAPPSDFATLMWEASILQNVTWTANSTFSFDWAVLKMNENSTSSIASYWWGGNQYFLEDDIESLSDFGEDSSGRRQYGFIDWTHVAIALTSGGSEDLKFELAGDSDAIFLIDNVRITTNAVPEPATMLLFGLGLLGIAGAGRKQKA